MFVSRQQPVVTAWGGGLAIFCLLVGSTLVPARAAAADPPAPTASERHNIVAQYGQILTAAISATATSGVGPDGGTPSPICGEASCTPVQAAYISHFTGTNCTGTESYYTPYFNFDGIR